MKMKHFKLDHNFFKLNQGCIKFFSPPPWQGKKKVKKGKKKREKRERKGERKGERKKGEKEEENE